MRPSIGQSILYLPFASPARPFYLYTCKEARTSVRCDSARLRDFHCHRCDPNCSPQVLGKSETTRRLLSRSIWVFYPPPFMVLNQVIGARMHFILDLNSRPSTIVINLHSAVTSRSFFVSPFGMSQLFISGTFSRLVGRACYTLDSCLSVELESEGLKPGLQDPPGQPWFECKRHFRPFRGSLASPMHRPS